ncbi:hypothetical protein D0B54_01890 [Solimonas sp. K1W22B-7]|uniref:VOC family protein n=1 Tax=Solimonas sp. K1W22B-7 TaxID=2303331 RepID=UPI000E332E76|nr:VOC family protein [Solimonas sp. K1W22B-7]AXQ27507.1 hypothetical protein D0B54_01890 [Solimonas sp. K1W22B-7]
MNHSIHSSGIRQADHTGFTVSSLDESLRFWIEVLGFRLATKAHYPASAFLDNLVGVEGAELTLAMVEAPDGHLVELLEYQAPSDRKEIHPRSCDVGSVHLAFLVDDLAELLTRCEAAGWPPLGEIQTVRGGVRDGLSLAYVRGPDGVTLEFLQPPRGIDRAAVQWKNSLNE